jgi:hypothetical protein
MSAYELIRSLARQQGFELVRVPARDSPDDALPVET